MIERKVPILISAWSGTGTVSVPSSVRFCMTTWLPRRLTSTNPWFFGLSQTRRPERTLSRPTAGYEVGDV
jgi:hypothetical protein